MHTYVLCQCWTLRFVRLPSSGSRRTENTHAKIYFRKQIQTPSPPHKEFKSPIYIRRKFVSRANRNVSFASTSIHACTSPNMKVHSTLRVYNHNYITNYMLRGFAYIFLDSTRISFMEYTTLVRRCSL